MYGVLAGFLQPISLTVAPLVPHRDCSEAPYLPHWIGLEPVYAQSSKFYLLSHR